MIPFKLFIGGMVGLTGVGWVVSGLVQQPAPKTIRDFVDMCDDGTKIKSFHTDRDGFAPKINCPTGGGGDGCCSPGK